MSGTTDVIHNARINLLATLLNNAALAFIVAGFIAPLVGGQFHSGWQALTTAVWVAVGVGLHISARGVLGRLR
jgi:hypothetical protein